MSHLLPHNPGMRFIHSADWQIGMRAVHAGTAADVVRAARFRTAARVCELAATERVDFLIIAGDTFENNTIDRRLVEKIAELLDRAACPVYVLPGNHDPVQPGCVWEHSAWQSARNVTLLLEPAAVPVPGGTLMPCPLRSRRSAADPTAWITNQPVTDGVRVVVAHGNAGDLNAEEGGFPIPLDTPARTGADYVALGHWHSTLRFGAGATRMAYSGTPESTRFGEPDSGNVLIVSIDRRGAAPEIRKSKTGELIWRQIGSGELVTAPGKLAEIARMLMQMPEQGRTLADVALKGLLFDCEQGELARIETACSRFLHARFDPGGLRPAPEDNNWVELLPAGLAQTAAARLKAMAAGDGAGTATQALLELYAFAQEVRS